MNLISITSFLPGAIIQLYFSWYLLRVNTDFSNGIEFAFGLKAINVMANLHPVAMGGRSQYQGDEVQTLQGHIRREIHR